jgi:hypothetical protein
MSQFGADAVKLQGSEVVDDEVVLRFHYVTDSVNSGPVMRQ